SDSLYDVICAIYHRPFRSPIISSVRRGTAIIMEANANPNRADLSGNIVITISEAEITKSSPHLYSAQFWLTLIILSSSC
ncbi:MAG: hypothetical protein ACI9DS_003139, partial [Glaciecola sp.]